MPYWIRQCAVGGLALWLVALSGTVYPQLIAHIAQHQHHNAATHATALCSWLCIAADAVENTAVNIAPVQHSTFLEQASPVTQFHLFHSSQPPSRAPPFA
ncbi:MAG TPA: hypothetical protein VN657_11380 [Nitrospiraceae bacterium]|nr:hypothetical protein [Nitrospiraceae bacterium]